MGFFCDVQHGNLARVYVFQGVGTGKPEDPRIQHYRVRKIDIDTHPAMPIMTDGTALGEGQVRIRVKRHALAVMVGLPTPEAVPGPTEFLEQQPDNMLIA